MTIRNSLVSCKEVGGIVGCDPRKATAVIRSVEEGLQAALTRPEAWAPSGRPDRVAASVTAFVAKAGPLAKARPKTFGRLVRQALEALEGGER